MDNKPSTGMSNKTPAEIRLIDFISDLLDSRFKIPGTNFRFGLDPLIGLLPGVGDIVSYAMGSALIIGMVRQGASFNLVIRMLWNLLLDTIIGSLPLVGDLFDAWFKSNRRNFDLFSEFVKKKKEPRSIWPLIIISLVVIFGLLLMMLYLLFVWLPAIVL